MLAALLLAACSVNKRTLTSRTEFQKDSVSHAAVAAADVALQTNIRTQSFRRMQEQILRSEQAEPIPAQTALVKMTEENLRNLPDGAAFVARDGRLTLEARRDGDTLRIVAHADSLARRAVLYEYRQRGSMMQSDSLQQQIDSLTHAYELLEQSASGTESQAVEEHSRSPAHPLYWLLAGLAAGCLAGWRVCRKIT